VQFYFRHGTLWPEDDIEWSKHVATVYCNKRKVLYVTEFDFYVTILRGFRCLMLPFEPVFKPINLIMRLISCKAVI
jgi:hypothetical protein